MSPEERSPSDNCVRAAGGVVWRRDGDGPARVLVVHRPRYDDWSLPKGKLDDGENGPDAAVREVFEETDLKVDLVGERGKDVSDPMQLHRPAGVQLENIGPGHQHIDLIYFARPTGYTGIAEGYSEDRVGWYGPEDWDEMFVNAEVRGWCERALSTLSREPGV